MGTSITLNAMLVPEIMIAWSPSCSLVTTLTELSLLPVVVIVVLVVVVVIVVVVLLVLYSIV
jgi:hypothetical protein